jgi:ribosomal protein L25 (general stress protein Ctc)
MSAQEVLKKSGVIYGEDVKTVSCSADHNKLERIFANLSDCSSSSTPRRRSSLSLPLYVVINP